MILLENKLEMFNKIVYKTKEHECRLKKEAAEKRIEDEIAKKKAELEESSNETIKRRIKLANKRKYEILAKVSEDRRISELQKHEELLRGLVVELEKKVVEFKKTDEYIKYYTEKFETLLKELEPGDYKIELMAEDKDKFFDLYQKMASEKNINLEYKELEPRCLGGFIITDKAETYNVDSSLKEKIEDKKYEIGKLLEFTLKKAGEED